MSKLFRLFINNENKVPVAVSNDKWLLELFIVQRSLNSKEYRVDKINVSKSSYCYNDNYLIYYFGYAVTNYEYEYINNMTGEYQSDLELRIFQLETSYLMHKSKMSKKERKYFKKTLDVLRRIDYSSNKKFASEMIDTVIHRSGMIVDYMDAINSFKWYMGGT